MVLLAENKTAKPFFQILLCSNYAPIANQREQGYHLRY